MEPNPNPPRLSALGRDLFQVLDRHLEFVRRTVAQYDSESDGGQMIYAASVMRREIEPLETVLADPFAFDVLDQEALSSGDHVALTRLHSLLRELEPIYDADGHHQSEIRSDWPSLTRQVRRSLSQRVPRIRRALTAFLTGTERLLAVSPEAAEPNEHASDHRADDPPNEAQDNATSPRRGHGGSGSHRNNSGDGTMANDYDTDGLIDAISRLQGSVGLGGSGGTASNAINAFSTQLDQTLNLTLGMPALNGDAAKALSVDDLVGKLFEGLDRTVADDEIGGVRTFEVNPLRARGASLEGQGLALGAQAVSASTIRSLKEPIMTNVYKLVSETTYGEQDEAEDLRVAIDAGLDQLIAEANSETGIYQDWAGELLLQIAIDLFRLGAQYGLLDRDSLPEDMHDLLAGFLLADDADGIITLREFLDKVVYKPAIDRILRDPDVGILTAEANDRAFTAVVHKLWTIARLLVVGVELGPLVGRIRAVNDALPASVISARNALAVAGVSEADQAVAFSKMVLPYYAREEDEGHSESSEQIYEAGGISLRRLLSWIEAESLTSRSAYLREDLNQRDVQRLIAPRQRQLDALKDIIERNFPMVNRNNYALGRRHLIELCTHLEDLVGLMRVLVTRADARSAT